MSQANASNLHSHPRRVSDTHLRWHCDPKSLAFETTDEVEPEPSAPGQEDAVEALRFGLSVKSPRQHVFVRGLVGTGRMALLKRILSELPQSECKALDRCFVHDFEQADRPRLISLPTGQGSDFRDRVDQLADFIQGELRPTLSSDTVREKRSALERAHQEEMQAMGSAFDQELRENGLAMVNMRVGDNNQTAIVPFIDGEAAGSERLNKLKDEGKLSAEDIEQLAERVTVFAERFKELNLGLQGKSRELRNQLRKLYETETRAVLGYSVREIESTFPHPGVADFLAQLVEDVLKRGLHASEEGAPAVTRYRVNLISGHEEGQKRPVVVENTPTLKKLIGSVEREFLPNGSFRSDHLMISAGSLLRAEGGFLIIEARDLLTEPGAWKMLVRALRTCELEIVPHELSVFGGGATLKPQPIPLDVKIVLLGDSRLYYALDAHDADFPQLFKVLADFEDTIERDAKGMQHYAGQVAQLVQAEKLPPFENTAIAALIEHGTRIAGRDERLSVRFGRLGDIAREAAFVTQAEERTLVTGDDLREAVRRSKRRADLPARNFRARIADGTIRINTRGAVVGQVNGLAVISAGPMAYGFPTRITASLGPGHQGTVSIERESQLSGAIHTKGFYILGGLLRNILPNPHPLAFSASIAFEQSYGGIDGDSASGAEICCLLSALTGIPLRQNIAMTGAIDQHGHIQPIGAVSEKIEGFFDTCSDAGLTGDQGVIIPMANRGQLMLRQDVVAACARSDFHVFAVDRIHDALEIFTGLPAGELDKEGDYPEGSFLYEASVRATDMFLMASGSPLDQIEWVEDEDGSEGAGPDATADQKKEDSSQPDTKDK